MHHHFDGLCRAAPQRVNCGNIAAADVGEYRTDGYQVRRHHDVDFVAFEQIDVAGTVDDGNHALGAAVFRQQTGHDIVFVVVGQGAKYPT